MSRAKVRGGALLRKVKVVGLGAVCAGLLLWAPAALAADGPIAPPLGELEVKSQAPPAGAAPAPVVPPGEGTDAPAPTVGVNFLSTRGGQAPGNESSFIPPDTTGAVGPTNVVTTLNGRVKIFTKAGVQQYSADLSDFFSAVVPATAGNFAFDPKVEYDAASDRWFVVALERNGSNNAGANNDMLIGISNGPDVSTGEPAFTFHSFDPPSVAPAGDAGAFTDYPTIAVTPESLLIGVNNFNPSYTGSALYVLDKSDLIAGTVTATAFRNVGTFTPQPVENDDPAFGATDYVIGTTFVSELELRRLTYPGGTPTLSPPETISTPYSDSSIDVPQPGATLASDRYDALDFRLYEAMLARDPVTGAPRLWTTHNMELNSGGTPTNSGDRIGSVWYEFSGLGGTPAIAQRGTLFDPAGSNPDNYWVPAIAANGQGNALLGSSVAGFNRFASVALAQRFFGETAGTLSPVTIPTGAAGADFYKLLDGASRNRWGDYSQVSIDPNDNLTFWAFQEYVVQGGANPDQWGVRVVQVGAAPPATPSSASPATIPTGQSSVNVTITGTSASGAAFHDPPASIANDLTATVSGGVIVNSVTGVDGTRVTLNLNTTAATPGPKNVTVTNPDGQVATGNGILTVVAADSDGDGIPDGSDACPAQAGPASNNGCPLGGGGGGGGGGTDNNPPTLELTAKKKQASEKSIKVKAEANEACELKLAGSVKPQGERKGKLKPKTEDLQAGATETLRLKPTAKVKEALKDADQGTARIKGTCTDAAGNAGKDTAKVKLT